MNIYGRLRSALVGVEVRGDPTVRPSRPAGHPLRASRRAGSVVNRRRARAGRQRARRPQSPRRRVLPSPVAISITSPASMRNAPSNCTSSPVLHRRLRNNREKLRDIGLREGRRGLSRRLQLLVRTDRRFLVMCCRKRLHPPGSGSGSFGAGAEPPESAAQPAGLSAEWSWAQTNGTRMPAGRENASGTDRHRWTTVRSRPGWTSKPRLDRRG